MEHVPDGGALVVSNHSGGLVAMDVPILAVSFTDHFGAERPFYVLAHDMLFLANAGRSSGGRLRARAPGERRGGAAVGRCNHRLPRRRPRHLPAHEPGQQDRLRRPHGLRPHGPDRRRADRAGGERRRPGGADPPLPRRGARPAAAPREAAAHQVHADRLGFPFGLTLAFPPNLPLPTKIRTRVLEPIDVRAEFGDDPDIAEVDRVVRTRMQAAADEMVRERRFPVLG